MTRQGTRRHTAHDLRETIALNLRNAQAEAGLKNEQLARETGISLRLLQKHRAGDNTPDWDNLSRYAAVLNKPVAWFLGEKAAA